MALAILAGFFAFVVALFFDLVAMKRLPGSKPVAVLLFISLHGYALYAACWGVERFGLPAPVSFIGWGFLPLFAFLLFYSLVYELSPGKTYYQSGVSDNLVTTGTYALTRHPGVIWYILGLAALLLATKSKALLVAAPVWSALDILYVIVQDRFLFIKMFSGYRQYQQQTPLFVPTRRSVAACLRTLGRRYY